MFRVFSAFSALLSRPKVRAAIQEHQARLLARVREDVRALQERFTRKYAGSESALLSAARDLPPVAGSIVWARQVGNREREREGEGGREGERARERANEREREIDR